MDEAEEATGLHPAVVDLMHASAAYLRVLETLDIDALDTLVDAALATTAFGPDRPQSFAGDVVKASIVYRDTILAAHKAATQKEPHLDS